MHDSPSASIVRCPEEWREDQQEADLPGSRLTILSTIDRGGTVPPLAKRLKPDSPGYTTADLDFAPEAFDLPVELWVPFTNSMDFQHLRVLHGLKIDCNPDQIHVGPFRLLKRPTPWNRDMPPVYARLDGLKQPLVNWPEPQTELEDLILACAAVVFAEPARGESARL